MATTTAPQTAGSKVGQRLPAVFGNHLTTTEPLTLSLLSHLSRVCYLLCITSHRPSALFVGHVRVSEGKQPCSVEHQRLSRPSENGHKGNTTPLFGAMVQLEAALLLQLSECSTV